MKNTDLVNFIVDRSTKHLAGRGYDVGEEASGKCYDASHEIIRVVYEAYEAGEAGDIKDLERLDMVIAEHPLYNEEDDIPSATLDELGFVNHFALWVDKEIIIDYTLRQFDEKAPYPFVGNEDEWSAFIATRWTATANVSTTYD